MGKRVKKLVLSVLLAVFGAFSLVGPVFAVPAEGNNNIHTPTITDVEDDDTPQTTENNIHTPTISDIDDDNPSDPSTSTASEAAQTSKSCSDQVGTLSWIICPGTGLLGNIIDGAYNILTSLMQVNPIPNDDSTPMYIVWNYFKNFTNSVFIIFLIIVILSQLTGIGISNYGIKKVLPRIIIAAILVNLSYIICTLAVDISNIFGIGLRGVFENIENIAVQNGSISDVARNISASSIIAGVIGVGGAATAVGGALVAFGGVEGAIWMLIPIILSGVFAVVSALITMAARQSLIFILAMISPLAIVAYMLPNTESWFKKWYQLFARMLVFYPLFSILYGASSLASLVIITTSISNNAAANSLGVILGLAVRILPLFASIPLMKMSGTVLEKVGGAFSKLTTPIAAAVGGYAGSQQALAKQKHVADSKMPSGRLARYLKQREYNRAADAKRHAAQAEDDMQTSYMRSRYNRNGKLNARGKSVYKDMQVQLHNKAVRQQIDNDFDEGFGHDGTDKRVKKSDLTFMRNVNKKFDDAIIEEHIANTRKVTVQRNNDVNRAEKIRAALQPGSPEENNLNNSIHQQVLDGFNIDKTKLQQAINKQAAGMTLTEAEKRLLDSHNEGKNFVLADAIAIKRKADSVMQSTMFELLDDTTAGSIPRAKLVESFKTKDYNSMKAAIAVMAKRGDHGDIIEELTAHSAEVMGDDNPQNIRFQKELNDICLSLKGDNTVLWSWGKANMIRRGKHDAGQALAGYIDLDSFRKGLNIEGDGTLDKVFTAAELSQLEALHQQIKEDPNKRSTLNSTEMALLEKEGKAKKNLSMVDMQTIFQNVRDGKLVGDMDRTVFNNALKYAQSDESAPMSNYYMTWVKGFRDSICSGKMDGEQLDSLNDYLTMGFDTGNPSLFYREYVDENGDRKHNYDLVDKELEEMFRDMSANQLSSFKSASLLKFNDALNAIDAARAAQKAREDASAQGITDENRIKEMIKEKVEASYDTVTTQDNKERHVNKRMTDLLKNQVAALNKDTAVNTRSNMNPVIREMLGIKVKEGGNR